MEKIFDYDYDKSLRDKSKDIQELTAQIAALENIDTAEAKGKKAKLQAELSEKQEDLEDTIFNHDLDLSKDALSDLKKILDEQFDEKWEHIFSDLGSLKELLNAANKLSESSTKTVTNAINQMLKFYGVDPVSTGVKVAAKYASGTKRVPKNLTALTNENGSELIVTKNGLITPLSAGDGVIPHDLTQRLYDMAMGKSTLNAGTNRFSMPEIKTGDIGKTEITQNYGSLINIEGSADAATVEDLKNMKKSLLEDSYDYTSKRIYKGHIHAGGKRVV